MAGAGRLGLCMKLIFTDSIFEKILRYLLTSQDARHMLESKETYKLPANELNELRLKCGRMYEAGEKVLHDIR